MSDDKRFYTTGIFTGALPGGIVSPIFRAKPGKERDMLVGRFLSCKGYMEQHTPSIFCVDSLSARSYKTKQETCMIS
jgi:hypothetical protein